MSEVRIMALIEVGAAAEKTAISERDERSMAEAEQALAALAELRGDYEDALDHHLAQLPRWRGLDDRLRVAQVLHSIARAHTELVEWASAEACFDEALEAAVAAGSPELEARVELARGEMYLRRQDFQSAGSHLRRALEIFSRLGADADLAETHTLLGVLHRKLSEPDRALAHLDRARERARSCRGRLLEGEVAAERALVHLMEGRNREALQALSQAHRIFAERARERERIGVERRLERLEGVFFEVVHAWAASIESKDRYTAGHCERVADYACLLAEAVGFSGRDVTSIRMGALIHDVGKIEIPAEVLNKPGKLTAEEWQLMKRHPVAGDEITSELGFPWDIRPMVRSHHERWDGGGYPDGLAGEAIPLAARILCVADVYDALTTTRPYRRALSPEEALEIMARDVGSALDPRLFEIFEARLREPGLPFSGSRPAPSPPR